MSANSSSATGIMNAATATKTSKKVAKKTEEVVAPAPAVVEAPKAETKKVAKKAEAKAKVEAEAPVTTTAATTTAAATTSASATTEVAEEVKLEAEVKAVTARLLSIREAVSEMITESKKLEKKAARLQKVADKRRRRKAAAEAGADGKPARISIFQIPTLLSPELCKFMGRPVGSSESRSNVTKYVTKYFKDNNLKNKHDIKPDAKLKSLLGLTDADKLTYFNLQTYLNKHYIKNTAASTTA